MLRGSFPRGSCRLRWPSECKTFPFYHVGKSLQFIRPSIAAHLWCSWLLHHRICGNWVSNMMTEVVSSEIREKRKYYLALTSLFSRDLQLVCAIHENAIEAFFWSQGLALWLFIRCYCHWPRVAYLLQCSLRKTITMFTRITFSGFFYQLPWACYYFFYSEHSRAVPCKKLSSLFEGRSEGYAPWKSFRLQRSGLSNLKGKNFHMWVCCFLGRH